MWWPFRSSAGIEKGDKEGGGMVDDGEDFARDASALKASANDNFRTYAMMCGSTAYHYDQIAGSLLTEGLESF